MDPAIPLPRPDPARMLAAAALAALVFAGLATDLLLHGPITRADVPVSQWFHAHLHPVLTTVLLAVTAVHGTAGICLMAAVAAVLLLLRGQRRWIPVLVAVVPGGLVLNVLVKLVFHRARPVFDAPLLTLSTSSFPSGHTAGATVWWGFVAVFWFACEARPGPRLAGAAAAALLVLLTAFSRVYLGAHYPSDVLAAVAEGTIWLLLCFAGATVLVRPGSPRHERA